MTAAADVLTPAAVEFLHLLQRELGSGRTLRASVTIVAAVRSGCTTASCRTSSRRR